jgi:hypothetical protein
MTGWSSKPEGRPEIRRERMSWATFRAASELLLVKMSLTRWHRGGKLKLFGSQPLHEKRRDSQDVQHAGSWDAGEVVLHEHFSFRCSVLNA